MPPVATTPAVAGPAGAAPATPQPAVKIGRGHSAARCRAAGAGAPIFPAASCPSPRPARAPYSLYAANFDPTDKHPRVAMVVSGAGLDQDATLHLLADLPAAVDVAFSAYMPEALDEQFAARARQTGHECLVSIPMEPASFPADRGRLALAADRRRTGTESPEPGMGAVPPDRLRRRNRRLGRHDGRALCTDGDGVRPGAERNQPPRPALSRSAHGCAGAGQGEPGKWCGWSAWWSTRRPIRTNP
ncbi:MAG: divergent polysaccharide deacetylase family protein [Rhodospirillales bacterium]